MPNRQADLHPPSASAHTAPAYGTCTFRVHSELRLQTWSTQTAEPGPGRTMNLECLWDRAELAHRDCLSLVSQALFEALIFFSLWRSYSWGPYWSSCL